jgi:integrase
MSVRKRSWITRQGEKKSASVVDYVDQAGARHVATFARKKDADDYSTTVKVDVRTDVHTAPSKSITVAQAGEDWLTGVEPEGRERATIAQYRQHAARHIGPRLGSEKLATLTTPRINTFRDDLLAHLSRTLAKKVLTSLKSCAMHWQPSSKRGVGRFGQRRQARQAQAQDRGQHSHSR